MKWTDFAKTRRFAVLAFLVAAAGTFAAAAQPSLASTSCTICHGDADLFGDEGVALVTGVGHGVHAEVGLSCHDCHGGNPDPALAEDMEAAMNPRFRENPYRGAPDRTGIPAFCGHCHSDPVYMKRFKPDPRIDQETEYRTSHHGRALAKGDRKVATCIDCHGVHGISRIDDPQAPVYPTNVAATCASCHGDPEHMAGYRLPNGQPIPVDQYARWKRSVHAAAMLEKGDLSAPTCNDCHGNHGATPPGVESIGFVCGQCHGREAELFRNSAKHRGFVEHNEYLAAGDGTGCRECHEPPEPQASVTRTSFSECTTCHQNHAIVRPTVAMLGLLPGTPCAFCHEESGSMIHAVREPETIFRHYGTVRDSLLAVAAPMELSDEDRFDWLVDRAQELPFHTIRSGSSQDGVAALRPEFARLFSKFRIGKVHYTYEDPRTGEDVRAKIVRCTDCHSEDGLQTARAYVESTREMTSLIGRAERILLTAERGGVEVREVHAELDRAVDSQIALEVLVHTFSADSGSAFVEKHGEGVEYASAALVAGQSGLEELGNRRRGLMVALGFILLSLIGLGLKIRQMSGSA